MGIPQAGCFRFYAALHPQQIWRRFDANPNNTRPVG